MRTSLHRILVTMLIVLLQASQTFSFRYYPDIENRNNNSLQILMLGDWGDDRLQAQRKVAQGMAAWASENNPDWVMTVGDNFYPRGILSTSDRQIDNKWRNLYNNESLSDLNWFITIGNHDFGERNGNEWNQVELSQVESRWHLPHLWYDFVIKRPQFTAHFIVIDTESFFEETNKHEEILPWFQTTLKKSTADWKFVVGHKHVFSAGMHGPVASYMYEKFLPLMEENNVDAYICGHDHNQQHLQYETPGGPDFVLTGAGGAELALHKQENEDLLKTVYGVNSRFFMPGFGFTCLTIDEEGKEVLFQYYHHDATLEYAFVRSKRTLLN